MSAALTAFFFLFAAGARGFWSYLLRRPGSLDGGSVRVWLLDGAVPLVLAAALWAGADGLGRRAARALRAGSGDAPDAVAAAALGLGLLGQAVFLLGWAGALRPVPLAALAAAALAAAFPLRRPRLPKPRWSHAEGAAAGVLAFAAFATLVAALAPPVSWDVRAYHLALPELALHAGRFAPVPWMIHAHWPHLMEALYALPLAAGSDGAAALLHWGASALLVGTPRQS